MFWPCLLLRARWEACVWSVGGDGGGGGAFHEWLCVGSGVLSCVLYFSTRPVRSSLTLPEGTTMWEAAWVKHVGDKTPDSLSLTCANAS